MTLRDDDDDAGGSSGNGGDDEVYDYAFGLVNKEVKKKIERK